MLRYERIEMFYHRRPDVRAKFVVIETESGRKLSLTELHLIPSGNCEEMRQNLMDMTDIEEWMHKSRFAYKAQIGECVFSVQNTELIVDRIIKVSLEVIFALLSIFPHNFPISSKF